MAKLLAWFEIPAVDFDRAVNFYQNVLQTELGIVEGGGEKMGCFPNDDENVWGAVSYSPGFEPSDKGVIISFGGGSDLNNFLQRVIENGGSVVKEKTKIEADGMGYFALFLDTEGNKLGIYSEN